jgi:long-chain fatty acid transport protein
MRNILLFAILSLTAISSWNPISASGFLIYEHGAAATGRAAAVAATIGDPSAIFYNPAGLGKLNGTNFYNGGTLVFSRTDFNSNDPLVDQHSVRHVPLLPSLFLTHKIIPDLSIGVGLFAPFGLVTDWPKTWEGRYIGTESRLQTIYHSAVIAYHPHPLFSIAVGFDYIRAEAKLERNIDFRNVPSPSLQTGILYRNSYPDGYSTLEAKGFGYDIVAGLQFGITEDFHVGVMYRQPIGSIRLVGAADFDSIPRRSNVYPNEFANDGTFLSNGLVLQNLFRNTDARTHIQLPPIIVVGIATTIIPDLILELDLQWTGWSTVDELNIQFASPVGGSPTIRTFPDGSFDLGGAPSGARSDGSNAGFQQIRFDWEDTYIIRAGLEYKLSVFNEKDLALRLGFLYDWSPARNDTLSTTLPDGNRIGLSAGVGYRFNLFGLENTVDLGYLAVLFEDVQKENLIGFEEGGTANGEYKTIAHLVSLSLQVEF